MKEIKVLGSGCAKCVKTAEFIQSVANDYGVMKTPAVVVDNELMHSGSIPSRKTSEPASVVCVFASSRLVPRSLIAATRGELSYV